MFCQFYFELYAFVYFFIIQNLRFSLIISRDRIPMELHNLFAATYDPGDQLSIRIMHSGYYRLHFIMHIFAYFTNIA